MKKHLCLLTVLAALTSASAQADGVPVAQAPSASHACDSGESWDMSQIPPEYADSFNQFLHRRVPPVVGFSEGLALRKSATNAVQKYFAEYWIARSLYEAKLYHIARDGFSVLASRAPTDLSSGVQIAALGCLVKINERYPALSMPETISKNFDDYVQHATVLGKMGPVRDAIALYAIDELGKGRILESEAKDILRLLQGSDAHESLIKGVIAAQKSDHSTAIQELRKFIASDIPSALRRYVDMAHLLQARSLYSVGQFEAASVQFKAVSKASNTLAETLSELAWSYLMDERYDEAIGTAMNLQTGGLRHTFAPEAPMVMAMAMNEICQFPEAIKASNVFKKNYEKPYKWLEQWNANGQKGNLYSMAVKYLNRQPVDAPDRVASEWLRSPVFISDQDEINLIFDERDTTNQLSHSGSKQQIAQAQQILETLRDLKPRYKKARAKQKPGEPLPARIIADFAKLRSQLIHFRRLQQAAPFWKSVLANYKVQVPKRESRLYTEIEHDLKARSARMFEQLDEIAENIQLIEVEIYNGASQDIIWQNAHPDFKKISRELVDQQQAPSRSKVWDWGRMPASDDEGGEVWEDELGSFKVDLVDNCSSKDRYVSLKLGRYGSN